MEHGNGVVWQRLRQDFLVVRHIVEVTVLRLQTNERALFEMRGDHCDAVFRLRVQIFGHPIRDECYSRGNIYEIYSAAQLDAVCLIHDAELRVVVYHLLFHE